jgi:acetyltransferase-like isoleucine patch superfamily enzyme
MSAERQVTLVPQLTEAVPTTSIVTRLRQGAGVARAVIALRHHGVTYGSLPCFIGRAPLIDNRGAMSVGDRFVSRTSQSRPSLATGRDGSLQIGDRVYVNQGAVVHADLAVTIGSHVLVADGVAICDTDFHEADPGLGVFSAPVVIEDNVWLARSVIVLAGARIGEGTVVAAGSVVRGELPAWVIAAGTPARPVRDIRTRGIRR